MTLDRFRSIADRAIDPFVRGADRIGLTPNAVSWLALALAVVAAALFALAGDSPALYVPAAAVVLASGGCDVLDGALAREQGSGSRAGDFLDHVLDRYADLAIVAGLAVGVGRVDLGFAAITGVMLTSYLGTQAQAVDLDRAYGGALGRADRLALAAAVGILAATDLTLAGHSPVAWLLVVYALAGHATAIQRFVVAYRDLREN
ncbi:MAG: CDP-alcohol phosphatidyltransferase family protein [Halococcoides sp.]